MLDQSGLQAGLERLRGQLEKNILERAEDEPSIRENLQGRYDIAKAAKRTGLAFELWRENEITQAAVAWLLGCVFVRFLEDNLLINQPWISGPGERLAQAKEQNIQTYRAGLHKTDRDYLLLCFDELSRLPGVAGLFDQEHNPLYRLSPTGHGARAIIDFFQRTGNDGSLLFDFTGTIDNTRFLGDLYQNISESARKRYALVQTPDFVVDFILDRTMNPALEEFGLEGFRIIDPACGSGHFLLAAFDRLFHRWQQHAPDLGPVEHANRALASIYGVDLNPFAVAIARFRLLIAALRACEVMRLRDNFDFKINLAVGDSLLHGTRPDTAGVQRSTFEDGLSFYYDAEDRDRLRDFLTHGRYHAVTGNPPYIAVQDPMLREAYRDLYRSCSGKYQLGVPFTQRFFDLAKNGDRAGYVGLITSNAFMKRSFGRTLVRDYLPRWDLRYIIDLSGAFIPGHATPTVVLLGRNCIPTAERVRVVRGIRGEAREPSDPATAPVWTAVVNQVDRPGTESKYVSVADAPRTAFYSHPWSIGGGGAAELKERLDLSPLRLSVLNATIGPACFPGIDDALTGTWKYFWRHRVPSELHKRFVVGDTLHHWTIIPERDALVPYSAEGRLLPFDARSEWSKLLWPLRRTLQSVTSFGGRTRQQLGEPWWSWYRWIPDRLTDCIVFAFVETHNQFALARKEYVYNRSVPVVIVPSLSVSAKGYIPLLGVLNSSTACFWLRQVCYPKGAGGIGGGIATESWEYRLEFDSAKLLELPLPTQIPQELITRLQHLADQRLQFLPLSFRESTPAKDALRLARAQTFQILARMIALQEELDWQGYFLYGLTQQSVTLPIDQIPEIELGQRAFEIAISESAGIIGYASFGGSYAF